jgi:ATP-dependent Clp protease ATP-binding subunit ClpC
MTSNVGSEIIYKSGLGFKEIEEKEVLSENDMKEKVMQSLQENFKPEFLNRLDEIITFHPINAKILKRIVDLQISQVKKRLEEKSIHLSISADAKEYIAKKGFSPSFGARPLKRVIQSEILDQLALEIIESRIKEGNKVEADLKGGKIVIKKK